MDKINTNNENFKKELEALTNRYRIQLELDLVPIPSGHNLELCGVNREEGVVFLIMERKI